MIDLRLKKIAATIAEKIVKSNYPVEAFNFESSLISIHCRLPPEKVVSELSTVKGEGKAKANRFNLKSIVCIENIYINPKAQNQGFFRALVQELVSFAHVKHVCVANVSNNGFAASLDQNVDWHCIEPDNLLGIRVTFPKHFVYTKTSTTQ